MEEDKSFTFNLLKTPNFLDAPEIQENIFKWGLYKYSSTCTFSFDKEFIPSIDNLSFITSFFESSNVKDSLKFKDISGKPSISLSSMDLDSSKSIDYDTIPVNITTMNFFNRLVSSNLICLPKSKKKAASMSSLPLKECMWHPIDVKGTEIEAHTTLDCAVFDEEDDEYYLFEPTERKEFIFQLFQHVLLGGSMNQYDIVCEGYLGTTKWLYKHLIKMTKITRGSSLIAEISLSSRCSVFKIKSIFGTCPFHSSDIRNFMFIIVDQKKRTVTVWHHECYHIMF
ncbi:Cilia- and flagella-associated protein 300 like protein [Aduncisulcus paluster]|uniref:Cilia- and flagella-associated protein 300 n=1 Tax=Aduncisulcus paluster TaxID=2918883 RepID=A0ABQ5K9R1_9EUKA|nr:Cilia- and flagella-associated protein 300 like protein [Aduncisulcus paluster]